MNGSYLNPNEITSDINDQEEIIRTAQVILNAQLEKAKLKRMLQALKSQKGTPHTPKPSYTPKKIVTPRTLAPLPNTNFQRNDSLVTKSSTDSQDEEQKNNEQGKDVPNSSVKELLSNPLVLSENSPLATEQVKDQLVTNKEQNVQDEGHNDAIPTGLQVSNTAESVLDLLTSDQSQTTQSASKETIIADQTSVEATNNQIASSTNDAVKSTDLQKSPTEFPKIKIGQQVVLNSRLDPINGLISCRFQLPLGPTN